MPSKRSVSPMAEEEKRKILKMLISPVSERRPAAATKSITEFMSLADKTIKAAKSAENLSTSTQVGRVIPIRAN